MSQIAALPNDVPDESKGKVQLSVSALPVQASNTAPGDFDMQAYQQEVPLWKRVHQHSLTQMMLLSVQGFCGPAMADAISGLGGGGLATPQTSNIATAISYAMLATVCFLGGPLVNCLGTRWALVLGALSFPILGASYYCNSKYGNQWFLILGAFISGTGTGCWYVAESGSIMSLAPSGARGKYLALWIVSRNLGQLIGGAIKTTWPVSLAGLLPQLYLAFVVIESLAFPFALLITPLAHVVRSDGTRILVSDPISTKEEFKRIRFTFTSKLILLSALWAVWSFFYGGTWSTYLATYFSVRARALSSLISPFFCIVGCFGLGFILDLESLSQRRRAQVGLLTVVLLNLGVYIWSIVMQVRFNANPPGGIDWNSSLYPSAFLPYFFVQTTGPLSQSYMYWLLSSFATDAQSVGQAIAYGMNTKIGSSNLVGFGVTFGLMGAAFVPMLFLVNSTPDRIPAEVIAEQIGNEQQYKIDKEEEGADAEAVAEIVA
ncbi:hypothetical protein EHS25_000632 [Saitozyma podzolica]|uniref:Major facilitator superfamily (MFS) profile domain-containing protein n=1 Tax=Saitozyma podzolica TaxID=1890683 RepID=A0A427YWM5_9TREE|nr:hypothetical protein EHS25_000632 [Saitozyma podzolica]